MAKILLVYANSFMDNLIPTGLSILSACLKKAGHNTKLFDTTFYKTVERTGDDARIETLQVKSTNLGEYGLNEKKTNMVDDLKKMVDEYQPDLIGLSIVETTQEIGLKLLNGIKDYDIPKIVGGVQVTMAPDYIISQDCVDMICVGEGEGAFVELANAIEKKEDYTHIKNLWIKKDGQIIKNPLR
ncbi:MAG: cobalamin-dependent protein, partial [Candidatus Undinarchaeales archaeon]|nr:cobalamin-dependent protein [Candidatus Undinarchaeales archaeon]